MFKVLHSDSILAVLRERCRTDYSKKPAFLGLRSGKKFIVSVVFCMAFTDIFLYGLIVPIIPRALQERVGLPADQVQSWASILLAVYGAALLVFAPIFGYLADHSRSRRFPLLGGLLILSGATILLTVAKSLTLFVVGRVLQGASAAMVWTVGLALLADTVNEKDLGETLGIITVALSMGTLLGPLLGGIVYQQGGYYDVFAIAFALLGLDIVLRLVMIEKKIAKKYEAPDDGTTQASDEIEDIASSEDIEIFGANDDSVDQAQSEPLLRKLPPVIFLLGSRRLLVGLWGSMVFGILLTGFDAVLPLMVVQTFRWSSSGSGLIFLPITIPALLGPFIGRLTDRYGPRYIAAAGFLLALPFYILLRLVTHKSLDQEVLLCVLLSFIGLALALISTPMFTEIIHIVYAKERQRPGIFGQSGATAQAYGLFNVAFAAGTIVGPLWAGYVRDDAGWGTMSWSFGLLSALTSIPIILLTGGWIGKKFKSRFIKSSVC